MCHLKIFFHEEDIEVWIDVRITVEKGLTLSLETKKSSFSRPPGNTGSQRLWKLISFECAIQYRCNILMKIEQTNAISMTVHILVQLATVF